MQVRTSKIMFWQIFAILAFLLVGGLTASAAVESVTASNVAGSSANTMNNQVAPLSPETTCTVNGVIETTDGVQTGRLAELTVASTCNIPRTCPGVFDTLNRHYDAYTYVNTSNASACITARLTPGLAGVLLQSAAYLTSFNPAALCQNYLADIGPVPNVLGGEYSFIVPTGATFVVTVNELVPNSGTLGYTLTVSSAGGLTCPTGATSTPTPTINISGTQTSIVATQTALAGTSTPNAGTQTAIAGTQTALAGTPTATSTPCRITFNDVSTSNPFYTQIGCLVCRGIVSGYQCGGPNEPCPGAYFRWYNNVTRGQTAKIVSNSAGFNEPVPANRQTYEDVPNTNTFWIWIERLSSRGHIGGYPCGQAPAGPCVAPQNRPYFRPEIDVTRGQLSKIVSNAAGFNEPVPANRQTFEDVPPSNPFYVWIERLTSRNVMGGYQCGVGPGGPCVPPLNRPYFRWENNASRGQTSKIDANAFFPGCNPYNQP